MSLLQHKISVQCSVAVVKGWQVAGRCLTAAMSCLPLARVPSRLPNDRR